MGRPTKPEPTRSESAAARGSAGEVFRVFLKLGMTSFGGPVAHLGYFRAEFVERRRWLSERAYVDLVALSQFLPGPASSQTGFGIGLLRGGYLGGMAAWLGFTLPSALLMLLFAYGAGTIAKGALGAGLLHGLKLVAVAIVGQAVFGMARSLCPDKPRAAIALAALVLLVFVPGSFGQVAAIALGGLAGLVVCRGDLGGAVDDVPMPVSRGVGIACLAAFFILLALAFVPFQRPASVIQRLLSLGRTRLWRRPCRAAAVARCGRDAWMGFRQYFLGRIWGGASRAGAAVHVRRLPWGCRGNPAGWRHRRRRGDHRDIFAGHFGAHGRFALLASVACASERRGGHAWRQRRGRRLAGLSALQPRVGERGPRTRGFRGCSGRVHAARRMARVAAARRVAVGGCRNGLDDDAINLAPPSPLTPIVR